MSFGVVLANDGKGGEALAHCLPRASEDEALVELVVKLVGDDWKAGGRLSHVRR